MQWKKRALAAVLFAFCAGAASAQPEIEEADLALVYGDRDFVSIATGGRQPLRKAPSVASVITADDIAAMGARTVDEALEAIPGLHVSRSSVGNPVTFAIRGILTWANPHVLMMVNGVPMTSNYLGDRGDVRVFMPVENVARIEVIRGPGSALYGADAFAGTINIITKTANEIDGTSFGARAGSFQTREAWVQHGSRRGELEIAGFLRVGSSDGARRTVRYDRQSAIDALALAPAASLAPGHAENGHDDLDAQLDLAFRGFRLRTTFEQRSHNGTGTSIAGALDPLGESRHRRFATDLSWRTADLAPDLALELRAAFSHAAYEITTPLQLFPPGAFFGAFPDGMLGAPSKWERQIRLSASGTYSGFADHRVRFGLGHDDIDLYRTREYKNFTLLSGPLPVPIPYARAGGANLYLAPQDRRVNYLYLQDEWSFAKDWTLTAGLRHDRYSDFGGTTNPRLALVWEARQDVTAKLLYGRAFRAPSFVELHAAANPVALGNPNLQPERIATAEASVNWRLRADLEATLSVFRHEIRDVIAIPAGGTTYRNGDRQSGRGGEFELRWQATAKLGLLGHYAYQKNIDEATGHDAGYAPHHHLYVRADWRLPQGWQLSGQVNRVAGRKRPFGDDRAAIADYTTTDLTLRSERVKQGWDFSASIYNLFNADVREPSTPDSGIRYDIPLPGRSFWLTGRYSL